MGAELAADVAPTVLTLHADVISRSVDEFIELVIRLISEPTFDERELGKLLRETQSELIESRDSDRALASRHFRRVLFEGHPYGRQTVGRLSTIPCITRADVEDRYRRSFVRGNLAMAFAGDITETRAHELAERIAASLPNGPRSTLVPPPPPSRPGRRLVFVDKPERTQAQLLIGTIGSHPRDPDHIALHVATTILGGTFTSRLMQEIRAKRGWSYGAYARLPYDRERDAFSLWTFPTARDASACITLELELLDAWRAHGISSRELSFVKRYLVRSHAFDVDTAQKRVHQKLDIELFDLPSDYHSKYREHVQAVTVEAANRAVTERISVDNLVISVVGTYAEIGHAVAQSIPRLDNVEVVAYDRD